MERSESVKELLDRFQLRFKIAFTELLLFRPKAVSDFLIRLFGLKYIANSLNIDLKSKNNITISVVAVFSGFLMSQLSLIKTKISSSIIVNLIIEFLIVFTIIIIGIFIFKFICVSKDTVARFMANTNK